MPPTLAASLKHSRYLQRLFAAQPELHTATEAALHRAFSRADMESLLPSGLDEPALKVAVRKLRQAVMARIFCRDLLGLAHLDEVIATVSDLAEVTILAALECVTRPDESRGMPIGAESGEIQQLIVVGMGKLGGRELNVSSDIDLIFVYPEDGDTNGPRPISNQEWFSRAGKRLIALIHDVTADGFVFRVDMRLRPYGDSGPLVSSFASLENYLLTQGREWERYAWIKGRAITDEDGRYAVAGPHPLGGDAAGLMQLVTPFVYRKYLDYGAYASMRDLHGQIQREVARRDMADNIKLGPGGIREVEFIAQVFQLIRGGRRPALRIRPTRQVLGELTSMGQLEALTVVELSAAYVFLRDLEHRLQYQDDNQTQMLPTNEADQALIAQSMGYASWPIFIAALDAHRTTVARHFELVFALPQAEGEAVHPLAGVWLGIADGQTVSERLATLGYQSPIEIERQLAAIAQGGRYQSLADKSRRRLDALIPPLIEVAAHQRNPDATLARILRFLETISRRESYLALLAEHPQTLNRLATLHSASAWVADYLHRHPILLDELLDARMLYSPPDWPRLGQQLRDDLAAVGDDQEAEMDVLRHFQHQQVFRLCAQDLAGQYSLTTLSDHLSDLADLILAVTIERAWAELPGKHKQQATFAAIGYGKLGGKELGYASDLDLIFVYEDEDPEAGEKYAKLARRIISWLNTATAAGTLYEVDLRLRPNGASGLLVSSVEGLAQYQQTHAWVWEHQALTRARFAAGDADIGAKFETVRRDILSQQRSPTKLAEDVVAMRDKMLATHPAKPNDVKYLRGGLVDVEFIVQYLVLAYANPHPALLANSGNIALLRVAAEAGLVPSNLAGDAQEAYRRLRELQHKERLDGTAPSEAALAAVAPYCEAVRSLWHVVFG
ncbi:bifunctional [glutamate--ammonia ligase]-adenylyl-L-tyrosine phosphorylase/[glutamate--ammonia-ligase] adenylyltransferase [Chitinimonas sp. BJB300]|uniref:bifunctional [glutamate--ammonia ligase]-adenylyl-L-tyrosine phosphorylase/[glutamate--ammonia-ligase] adenylyltransferase n=1 Tax=Chitinimonas sp. BJB300 TaxID=1559339 RepID=UPI000C11E351|nr:bifunctional [glutamate--ammonia ligase]-adenylyl-L-tyrosine phosphorylase/[glutamate--ammonia-ligase] adenylyltransferase [Chitinimonas sp. BJB300]PHV11580.1 bifunctional [glutamate--ammonia ligase]-adenylyl-L-tyrosine phosphorylase/[glutamate--ammonia-ligase] adenylyltransferase [Chitinimonas sp. BJB300]TSJ88985.1 bifunctional [glutamate--ammonia ligase]-adenylyl-L-tyrosine phosphorylase/[glutamate--ammonia-ligase] adenylyltransferase [Chitinimonas sp. BJB300]